MDPGYRGSTPDASDHSHRSLCYVSRHQSKRSLDFARRSTTKRTSSPRQPQMRASLYIDDSTPPCTCPHPFPTPLYIARRMSSLPLSLFACMAIPPIEAFFVKFAPRSRPEHHRCARLRLQEECKSSLTAQRKVARQCLPLSARCRVEGSRRSARRLRRWVEGFAAGSHWMWGRQHCSLDGWRR